METMHDFIDKCIEVTVDPNSVITARDAMTPIPKCESDFFKFTIQRNAAINDEMIAMAAHQRMQSIHKWYRKGRGGKKRRYKK